MYDPKKVTENTNCDTENDTEKSKYTEIPPKPQKIFTKYNHTEKFS